MQPLNTSDILKLLQTHQGNRQPTPEAVSSPNYPFYIAAPYWLQHQAVCLLAGIAVLDKDTFDTLIHLTELQLKMNLAIQKGGSFDKSENLTGSENFPTFIIKHFPIPHDKIHYLRNLNEFITAAIENKELEYVAFKHRNYQEKLLDPNRVIHALVKAKQVVSVPILESLDYQKCVDRMQFPKIFPDEITLYGYWETLRIKKNSALPRSLSSLNILPISDFVCSKPLCTPADPSTYSSLNSEEQQLPINQLLFHVCNPARNNLLSAAGIADFLKILQNRRPCPQSLFKHTTWNLFEAFLAYKNIDPNIFEEAIPTSNYQSLMRDIVLLLDKEERLYQNIQNHFSGDDGSTKQITQKEFLQFLIQKNYSIPVHFSENYNNNALNSELQTNPPVLTKRGQRFYEMARTARNNAIDLALEFKFPDKNEKAKRLNLIEAFGNPSIEEFIKYKEKGAPPSNLETQHRCRALAKLIKHFEPHLSIAKLRRHSLMQHILGREISKIKSRTFSSWMNEENIRDRIKKP